MNTNLYVIGLISVVVGVVWWFGTAGLIWVGCAVVGALAMTGYGALYGADVDRAVRARTAGNRGNTNNGGNSNKGGNAPDAGNK
jgi:hypothetical protein